MRLAPAEGRTDGFRLPDACPAIALATADLPANEKLEPLSVLCVSVVNIFFQVIGVWPQQLGARNIRHSIYANVYLGRGLELAPDLIRG